VDETGCSDFGDKREATVLVPSTYKGRSMRIPVERQAKRSILTACIAADGYRAGPFVIVERHTAEMERFYYGYNASNVPIVTQAKDFMISRLFEVWAERGFFPAVEERRTEFRGYYIRGEGISSATIQAQRSLAIVTIGISISYTLCAHRCASNAPTIPVPLNDVGFENPALGSAGMPTLHFRMSSPMLQFVQHHPIQ
jgi:hypothetical protein